MIMVLMMIAMTVILTMIAIRLLLLKTVLTIILKMKMTLTVTVFRKIRLSKEGYCSLKRGEHRCKRCEHQVRTPDCTKMATDGHGY